MFNRPLTSFSIPAFALSTLTRNGYETVDDLSKQTPEGLASELRIPLASSQAIFSATQAPRTVHMTQSAAALVGSARTYRTQCAPLDRLLDGGLRKGSFLELSGAPGCGKEHISAGIARAFVAASEHVLFVDMQNMIPPATLGKLLRTPSAPSDYRMLVHHLRLHTLPDLLIFLRNLTSYLQTHPQTSLLVLNSISFPFQSLTGMPPSSSNAILTQVKKLLTEASAPTKLTVVITSQLATKFVRPDGSAANFDTGSKAVMVPQLGSAYLPSGRTFRVVVIPQSRTSGAVRLLSSPKYSQEHGSVREEPYQMIGGVIC